MSASTENENTGPATVRPLRVKFKKASKSARTPRLPTLWEQHLVQYAVACGSFDEVAGFSDTSVNSVKRLVQGTVPMQVGTIGAIVRHAHALAVENGASPTSIWSSTSPRSATLAEQRVISRAIEKTDGGVRGLADHALVSHETIRRAGIGASLYAASVEAVVTAAEVALNIDPGTGVAAKPGSASKPAPTPGTVGDAKIEQLRAFAMGLGFPTEVIAAIERAARGA